MKKLIIFILSLLILCLTFPGANNYSSPQQYLVKDTALEDVLIKRTSKLFKRIPLPIKHSKSKVLHRDEYLLDLPPILQTVKLKSNEKVVRIRERYESGMNKRKEYIFLKHLENREINSSLNMNLRIN